jgi:translation initiation factor IF-1
MANMNHTTPTQVGETAFVPLTGKDVMKRQKLKDGEFGVYGWVSECLPNTMFRVKVLDSDITELVEKELLVTLAGKMRMNRIRVMPGDKVVGYVTKYDLKQGKITYRLK